MTHGRHRPTRRLVEAHERARADAREQAQAILDALDDGELAAARRLAIELVEGLGRPLPEDDPLKRAEAWARVAGALLDVETFEELLAERGLDEAGKASARAARARALAERELAP